MPSFFTITYAIANLSLLLYTFLWFQKKVVPVSLHTVFTIAFAWKLVVTMCGAALFYYYFPYETDPKALFRASLELKKQLEDPSRYSILWNVESDPLIGYSDLPRAFFMVKILFFLNFLTGGNYWLDSIWLSTGLFFSAWVLSLQVRRLRNTSFYPCLIGLLFFPTTVFWSSGILKETVGLMALCLLLLCYLNAVLENSFPWGPLAWAIIPCYVLLNIRFYALAAFLMVAIPYFAALKSNVWRYKYPYVQYVVFVLSFLLMGFLLNWSCQIMTKVDLAELTYYTYEAYSSHNLADYKFRSLSTSWYSIWAYAPEALWRGLFSPVIWQSTSFLSFCEAFFNSLSLMGLVFCLIRWAKQKSSPQLYLLALLIYITVSAVFIALSSPNAGSLARYKTMYMPFFHYLLLAYLLKWSGRSARFAQFFAYFSGQKKIHP